MKKLIQQLTSIIVATSMLILQSCATMFSGTKDQIHFQSSKQEGAKVLIDGFEKGTIPCTLSVKKKAKTITYEMEGYKSKTIEIEKSVNALTFLNGGLLFVGFFLD